MSVGEAPGRAETVSDREDRSQDGTSDRANHQADADWGFSTRQSGTSRGTKLGLAVMALLLCVFGLAAYRKFHPGDDRPHVSQAPEAVQTGGQDSGPEAADDLQTSSEQEETDPFAVSAVGQRPSGGPNDVPQFGNGGPSSPREPEPDPFAHDSGEDTDVFAHQSEPAVSNTDASPVALPPSDMGHAVGETTHGPAVEKLANPLAEAAPDEENAVSTPADSGRTPTLRFPDGGPGESEFFPANSPEGSDAAEPMPPNEFRSPDNEAPGEVHPPGTTDRSAEDGDWPNRPPRQKQPAGQAPPELFVDETGRQAQPEHHLPTENEAGLTTPSTDNETPQGLQFPDGFQDGSSRRHRTTTSEFPDATPSDSSGTFGVARPSFPAENPAADVHVVQPGDNYWRISKMVYGTPRYFMALARYNREQFPDPKTMRPGMKVLTPSPQVLEARYPDLFSHGAGPNEKAGASETTEVGLGKAFGFFRNEQGQPMYRVGKDDTLSEIARTHLGRSARWIQIYELNRDRLPSPHNLKIGTELHLPADAAPLELLPSPSSDR